MKEKWKSIKGWEDYYQISNLGRVKRIARKKDGLIRKDEQKERILHQSTQKKTGFLYVQLYKLSYKKVEFIHRLVATYFVKNPGKYGYVEFIDGNKTNCKYDNLLWVDRSVLFRKRVKV